MPPEDSPKTNRLADATSAYLRQHMNNPVDWHPWGEEAFAEARRRDVPVCVSIGYSACHWCHVMEHESFENPEIAAQMNRDFVCIKVDREERPDVDQIYMDTVTSLTGHGGWPLTVFCTPEGKPFYAGTYYPPVRRFGTPAFPEILQAVCAAWHDQRDQVEGTAQRILEALSARGEDPEAPFPGKAEIQAAARELLARADRKRGGFGGRFPARGRGHRGARALRLLAGGNVAPRALRPRRGGLPSLLRRRGLDHPTLREDALRPGAADSRATRDRAPALRRRRTGVAGARDPRLPAP